MEINRYESDRSFKEKMELEKQKLKSLSWSKKLEYIFNYYKWHFVGLVAVGFVIYMIGTMIYNTQYTDVFSAIILNGNADGDAIAEDFKGYCQDTEKFNRYSVNAGMKLDGKSAKDQDTLGIMLGSIASKEVQVLIVPGFQMERYMNLNTLTRMDEVLTEDQIKSYGENVYEYGLKVSDNKTLGELGCFPGEDAYRVVLSYVEDFTYIREFAKYLMGE